MKKLISILVLCAGFTIATYAQDIVDTNKWYTLENAKSNGKMANNGQKTTGAVMVAKLQIATGGHWRFIPNGDKGLYRIQNRDSKMFLANFGARQRGSKIKQTNSPGPGALWRVIKLAGGGFLIQNNMTSMFIGIIESKNNTPLIQATSLSSRIVWKPAFVQPKTSTTTTTGTTTNAGPPKNTNAKAFRAKRGGRVAKVVVRYTDQISFVGKNPRVGQRVYFFHQQLANARADKISFNPKHPKICGNTYIVTQVLPKIKFNKPMPNMRNRTNDSFMFVVEIF
ncbi:RICIN domain-containing protein [Kordia jejudonensis]|uniref:RICIN domain-containing protein n=1 Tax=Kordia jejudonensis TaxID=1348245 RepID=UPI000629246E|nr:RICIN domain-containing protein [Kordia jejudonensis]